MNIGQAISIALATYATLVLLKSDDHDPLTVQFVAAIVAVNVGLACVGL
jgi:hypothetical protein